MKSTRRTVTAVVVLLLGVAALLFGLRSCDTDDASTAPEPSASPSESPLPQATKMGTTLIEENIKARLDANAGRATRVACPDRVAQKIGTTFECEVFYADEPGTAPVSIAAVEVDGPDGAFTWSAQPVTAQ